MWYPPEVLETTLFHSQIDIWSFGITIWEATSYGQMPYKLVRNIYCSKN
jgi:serine/threonine protein kinase